MEKNEKKKLTKRDALLLGVLFAFIVILIALIILVFFCDMPELRWIGDLCAGIMYLIIGCLYWGKSKWQSIAHFVLSAGWAAMGIIGLFKLYA